MELTKLDGSVSYLGLGGEENDEREQLIAYDASTSWKTEIRAWTSRMSTWRKNNARFEFSLGVHAR
jgi:hypothetical protein